MNSAVDEFLAHYASKYYDPVKAKEYYERTKQLKGREPALSKESRQRQQEATSYVSNEIKTRREADLKANADTRTKLTEAAKARAEAHKARMEKISKDAEAAREKIVSSLKGKLEELDKKMKIPENASPRQRAFLEKQRATQMQTLIGKAKESLAIFQTQLRVDLNAARSDYTSFREKNTADRRANADQRRSITEGYRKDLETEKQNIKAQVR